MIIKYDIVLTILNIIDNSTSKFTKTFECDVIGGDAFLYNNYHILSNNVYILDMFSDEVDTYCKSMGIEQSSIEVDEFEITSTNDRVDVFFESDNDDNSLSLKPTIKCYIYPKNDALKEPILKGSACDSTTIIWTWPEDEQYAHYLVEEAINPDSEEDKGKIIAQLPIGATNYIETGLEPNTAYTRRLINYTDQQTSIPSASVTVMTETVPISQSLEEYNIPKNYDFTSKDSEREIITENLEAFHSGIGDFNDLKVYKQMDADFYQKFKTYFQITGKRIQREKRYEQVGFNYKICLEATEEVEEQEGEVTFEIDAYPRENITVLDYMWATAPVPVKIRLSATVFLRKPIPKEDVEEVKIYKPIIEPIVETQYTFNNASLIISLDCSTSQRKETPGGTRRDIMVNAAKMLIDKFEAKAPGQLEYVIVGWAGNTHVKVFSPGNANAAKSSLDTIECKDGVAKYDGVSVLGNDATDFKKGLTAGKSHCHNQRIGQIFFTDGFCNMNSGTRAYGRPYPGSKGSSWTNANCDNVLNSITEGFNESNSKTVVVFGAPWNVLDPDMSAWTGAKKESNLNFQHEVFEKVKNNPSPNKFKVIEGNIDNGNAQELADKLAEGIELFTANDVIVGYRFAGWQEQPEDTSIVNKYDIDDIKMVTVTSDVYTYKFTENKTPVEYSEKEKRAIIPLKNFVNNEKVTDKSVYDIIMEKIKQTKEWQDGYNKTIGTVEADGEPDKFLIKGLHIEDTYNFGDEDKVSGNKWGTTSWEDGLEGTVNTYTDIDKAGTTTYGDDCYLVSKNNYLMINGYTDGIIYDGEKFTTTELNAYDHSSEPLISETEDFKKLLKNRKKKNLEYSGSNPIHHVIDIIEKDEDIFLTGIDGLVKEGDHIVVDNLEGDLIAHIDKMYQTPVLNYRFNLEDPDAKTSLYEIMPDCDPKSNFLHVVILHVYYAKNVWITNKNNYVELWPVPEKSPIAFYGDPSIPLEEDLYKWTKKEHIDGTDNGWYITDYVWFMAKPMKKIQDYYDELPGEGMESFYGLVNGRYSAGNSEGKKDLRVDTPQFNIPTTVTDKHKDSIRIYTVITEFHPNTALVSYRWEHPYNNKDNITQVNGDYIYFSSDTLTYKDIEYYDIISSINMENQEVFDNKTQEKIFQIKKPETIYEYQNYYLEVHTDNSDVLALRYPTEIIFDENDIAQVGVAFKGVVNATSKWAPRIHNGYYYLNQHEYFAYSEFDVEANFETYDQEIFKTQVGYVSFDVQLRHAASPKETYSIKKDTRSELMQDESQFQWVNGKGLTLKPIIEGEYYKEYNTYIYTSPVILFDHALTKAGTLSVDYQLADGKYAYIPMELRYYDIENERWSEWENFENDSIPEHLSSGYQIRFIMQASITNIPLYLEDYLCCYLDWKDDMDENNTINIVTITDHMTTGPEDAEGIYISKILDFSCDSELCLSAFDSNYKDSVRILIAYSSVSKESLYLENIKWIDITADQKTYYKGKYFRYKIIVPSGEKLYWLRKQIKSLETKEELPYLKSISMAGEYQPTDVIENFIKTESFEIPKDGEKHEIFSGALEVIGSDVLEKGYTEQEIQYVRINCITNGVRMEIHHDLSGSYPSMAALTFPINAWCDIDLDIVSKNTPYIFVEKEEEKYDVIRIIGTPQQYCPIVVEDPEGNTYTELKGNSFIITETFDIQEQTKYVQIKNNRYDPNNIHVYLDEEELPSLEYTIINHLIIFNDFIDKGHIIKIKYCILYSFIPKINRENNTTVIYLHTGENIEVPEKCKVYFETGKRNNKFIANDLSLNPVYRTDYKGFIYLTDEHVEPYKINIYANPLRIKAGGFDKIDVSIEVLDIKDNPVISKNINVDCKYGILNCENYITDMNGVVHLVYESSYKPCTDIITVKVLKDDNSLLEQSISIINE